MVKPVRGCGTTDAGTPSATAFTIASGEGLSPDGDGTGSGPPTSGVHRGARHSAGRMERHEAAGSSPGSVQYSSGTVGTWRNMCRWLSITFHASTSIPQNSAMPYIHETISDLIPSSSRRNSLWAILDDTW